MFRVNFSALTNCCGRVRWVLSSRWTPSTKRLRGGDISEIAGQDLADVRSLVEKHNLEGAPANLAVIGRYAFTGGLRGPWKHCTRTWNEIQLTDALQMIAAVEGIGSGTCLICQVT